MPSIPDRLKPPPPANTPTLDAFVQNLVVLAKKFGINTLVIAGVDPRTQQQKLYGSTEAIAALRGLIADKLGLFDGGETGWEA